MERKHNFEIVSIKLPNIGQSRKKFLNATVMNFTSCCILHVPAGLSIIFSILHTAFVFGMITNNKCNHFGLPGISLPTPTNVLVFKAEVICGNIINNDHTDTFKFNSYKILPMNLFRNNKDVTYLSFFLQASQF